MRNRPWPTRSTRAKERRWRFVRDILLVPLGIQTRQMLSAACLNSILTRQHIPRPGPGGQARVIRSMSRVHRHDPTLPRLFHALPTLRNPTCTSVHQHTFDLHQRANKTSQTP